MHTLNNYILQYGQVVNDEVLKVDAFLNHQIDANLMMEIAEDIKHHFKEKTFTKIITIETSGIAPSVFLGYLLQIPVVFMKKGISSIMNEDMYHTSVHSFTKHQDYELFCKKEYLRKEDHILFIDDFLANGEACLGAIRLIEEANASLDGIAIVIEKGFQNGRAKIQEAGYEVYAQARIRSLKNGTIEFHEEG